VANDASLIVNLTRGNIACDQAVIADRALRRMRGLLGRRELPAGDGILLQPAPSIHTAFMRFPIDVVFLDRNLEVLKLVEELPAWRTASALHAKSVLELAAGEIAGRGITVGDQLAVVRASGGSLAPIVITPGANGAASKHGAGAAPIAEAVDGTRVLLLGSDRRFRSLAALLLTRRGCVVTLGEHPADAGELPGLAQVEVVVLDAGASLTGAAREAALIERADPPVGLVVVGEAPEQGLSAMPVLAKWGAFDDLYSAIVRARPAPLEGALGGRG
jgi:uncharacterized membrane protein (UPF0127 family)